MPWIVRAIWEEHVGLVPLRVHHRALRRSPSAIWDELTELAGGAAVSSLRRLKAPGRRPPLDALHFTDIVLAQDPDDRGRAAT